MSVLPEYGLGHAVTATRGMVTAPHHLAAQSGLAVLREGGNAIEAMIAAAAAIAVAYPHMNGIGGDGFWLILPPDGPPVAIEACGPAARAATPDAYAAHGLAAIPSRGPLAANTVAGTVGGWQEALAVSATRGGRLPLARLLEDAILYAEQGIAPSRSYRATLRDKAAELAPVPGFTESFAPDGVAVVRQPRLGRLLRDLAAAGPDDFYRGGIARRIAADLAAVGSPLVLADLETFRARRVAPLTLQLAQGTACNLPPPTQGLASLLILGIFERLGVDGGDGFAHIHGLVEATKRAFLVRDAEIADPAAMGVDPAALLAPARIASMAATIDSSRAMPWPASAPPADTIWMGAIDGQGCAVSFIQSLYWEFGSGVVLPETGLVWQNRGSSFSLAPGGRNRLAPGRRPFHTLNPAGFAFADGRRMVYGTMGGDGQPQSQAQLFTRYARFGRDLQAAIGLPRWLLGRTWGSASTTLKLEEGFDPATIAALQQAGHAVEIVAPRNDLMGHAGALVRRPDGVIEGAADPRSDGAAVGF